MTAKQERPGRRHLLRRTVLLGLFTGMATGAGYLLSGVPNVELMTCVVALAGGTLGPVAGATCGGLAMTVYSLGNPFGAPVPVLLAAQAVGMGAVGWLGGVVAPLIMTSARSGHRRRAVASALLLGVASTGVYDLLTNLAGLAAFALDWRVVVAGAVPFTLLHQLSNALLFGGLFPWLLPRCMHLAASPLRGRGTIAAPLWLLLLLGAAPAAGGSTADVDETSPTHLAAADSLTPSPSALRDSVAAVAAENPDQQAARDAEDGGLPPGFRRPLWAPFPAGIVDLLDRQTSFVSVRDGGLGAPLVFLHETGTTLYPLFVRDGVPQATGHRWADDPSVVPITGQNLADVVYGLDGWGGMEGVVQFQADDPQPEQTFADTRFDSGPHFTKLRSIGFLTPYAPWRLRFDFEEMLDQEGYDFYLPGDPRYAGQMFVGESKFRTGRGSIERIFSSESSFTLAVASLRKHKTGIPSASLQHQEIWGDHVAMIWRDRLPTGRFHAALYRTGRDVERDWYRKVEIAREGAVIDFGGKRADEGSLRLVGATWRLDDNGAGAWAGPDSGAVHVDGQEAGAQFAWPWGLVGLQNRLAVAGWWDSYGGTQWGGRLTLATPGRWPWLQLIAERGGRAPRSDELWTPDVATVVTDSLRMMPNRDLAREETLRGSLLLRLRFLGLDFATEGSVRRLRRGIVWAPLAEAGFGQWRNDLALDSHAIVVRLGWQGKLYGWAQLTAETAWRGHDLRSGPTPNLPPERSTGVSFLWEKRFFHEDGILQFGYWYGYRSEMTDPFIPNAAFQIPAVARHDLLVGFRLLGVDLGMELRNLADERLQLTTGAFSDGLQLRWRLQWKFSQ